jgi:hypothetical protein
METKKFILIAETFQGAFFPRGNYKNILQLETDIAQISSLILLFSESYGSAVELGAFATLSEISKRLLVVIDDHFYDQESFVRLGPIKFLEETHGSNTVCVLDRDEIGITVLIPTERIDFSRLNMAIFFERVNSAILSKTTSISSSESREHTTLNKDRPGHIIKLITGLIQHYGALTEGEIEAFLDAIKLPQETSRIHDYLVCAQLVEWIDKKKRGGETFYFPKTLNKSMSFGLISGIKKLDRIRWKADIVSYWKKNDPERFGVIRAGVIT